MCGITGFFNSSSEFHLDLLKQMTDVISHRGPDDSGYELSQYESTQIGLGHRRLSILDLSPAGHQPMERGDWQIVYNGEIYNFQAIRTELQKLGKKFDTHTDTEVILASFDEWGERAVHRFIGMFAFVIINRNRGKAWFFRDRLGVKPLYFYACPNLLVFASELKSLFVLPQIKPKVSKVALAWYMKLGYVPEPYSMLEDVFKLKAGNYLELDLVTLAFTEHPYWSITEQFEKGTSELKFEQALAEFELLCKDAFKLRMVADVPVGVFFSGGYDSTLVAALLQQIQGTHKLRTFTIGFSESSVDESKHAAEVAAYLQTDHTSLMCTEDDAVSIIAKLPIYFDEPISDVSCIPTLLLSQKTREHVTVALSADGGDELFGGYDKYFSNWGVYEKLLSLPAPIRKMIGVALRIVPIIIWKKLMSNAEVRIENFQLLCSEQGESKGLVTKIQAKLFSERQIKELINTNQKMDLRKTAFHSITRIINRNSFQNALLAVDAQTFMRDDILVKVDRASMAASLESREPLIDHRIVEFAAKLPFNFKIENGVGKCILKELVHKYVPYEMMNRPKQGFIIPLDQWLRSKLKFLIEDYLSEASINSVGILKYHEIEKLLIEFNEGIQGSAERLWRIIVLQMWLKHYNVKN
jgi:asparagine synthase (glutamine-hydrolysing)